MPRLRYGLVLAIVLATSACAEIEFGVPAGGAATGGAGVGAGEPLVGGGGGSPPLGEQCLNGTDDDDDGLADCADEDCPDVSCVEIPPGWMGPVELREDDSDCTGAFSEGIASLKTKVEAPEAVCSCACNGNDQTCDGADMGLFGDGTCGNVSGGIALDSGQCALVFDSQGVDSYQVTPNLAGGGCLPGVDATLPPVTFEARRLCGLPAETGGCDGGVCAPSATCVYLPGNVVCPTGFGTPFMGNAGVIDTRSCTSGSCTCGAATGGCSFVLETFNNSNCQGGTTSTTTTTMCQNVSFGGGGDKSALYTATPAAVSCPPAGTASPTGSVTASEPITVCCAL